MDEPTARPPVTRESKSWRWPVPLAGLGGSLFLAVATSPWYSGVGQAFLTTPGRAEFSGLGWVIMAVPIAATLVGLCALRWWPYLLTAAGLLAVAPTVAELTHAEFPLAADIVCRAGYPLAVVGVLACAQSLVSSAVGWAAAVAGLTMGARLFGTVLIGPGWLLQTQTVATWHAVLTAVGLAALAPAVWRHRRGDRTANGPSDQSLWSWQRLWLIVPATLAMCVAVPLSFLTTDRLAALLGVTESALYRHRYAEIGVIGVITLVTVAILAAIAGLWSLAGTVTAAVIQVAVAAPMLLAVAALAFKDPVRLLGALAGVALGVVAAGNRWRVPLAGTATVLGAAALFIAYGATTGHPEKLADQRSVIPGLLILVLVTAAATAVVGATAPVLAPRGALPAVLGPLAATLAAGGLQTVSVTYLHDGEPVSSTLNSVYHLTTSAVLLLVAGAAIGGLGFAQQLAVRRAERKQTEQIRWEAAAAERDRLARPIHDGVLQVLALVQRHGPELGGQGSQLAALAGEQEVALRTLLSRGVTARGDGNGDLRTPLRDLASPAIEVATPAQPVVLPAIAVTELTAAVQAALDNVRQHAGAGAHAWVLLEDERDGVRVTVRDDGVGVPAGRLDEAAASGRLGVAQSMCGRVADRGGTTTIHSTPGQGTEVEFWLPRRPSGGR
ncbi:sensor histidine kinase [Rugosimonospora africana]|nr:ATP-binding protein [Rugosimonospora africana]